MKKKCSKKKSQSRNYIIYAQTKLVMDCQIS